MKQSTQPQSKQQAHSVDQTTLSVNMPTLSIEDNRESSITQRKLADVISQSTHTITQYALGGRIQLSSRMGAQRNQMASITGNTTRHRENPQPEQPHLSGDAVHMAQKTAQLFRANASLPASIAGFSHAPLQAVWQETDNPHVMQWDKAITGIRWFYNLRDDSYYYQVDPGEHWYREDDPIRQGENQARPYGEWHAAGATKVSGIEARVQNYETAHGMKREMGKVRGTDQAYVEDNLPAKYDFLHKDQTAHTHFHNTYSPQAAIMRENYRTPELGKSFFASDVFFSQLAAVATGEPATKNLLASLPKKPPEKIIRDTIDNDDTKRVLQQVNPDQAAVVTLTPDMPQFGAVLQTPNGKATFNLLNDFNFINRRRELPAYTISEMIIRKSGGDPNTGWKIELHLSEG